MKKSILIIDDTVPFLRMMERIFSTTEFVVECVKDGETALLLLTQKSFPLVFIDLEMPSMHGSYLCTQVRQRFPSTLCIAMTSAAGPMDSTSLRQAGFDDCFIKPETAEEYVLIARAGFEQVERWKALQRMAFESQP